MLKSILPLLITVTIIGMGIIPEGVSGIRCFHCKNETDCHRARRTVKTIAICRPKDNKPNTPGHSYCFSIIKQSGAFVWRGCAPRASAICMITHQSGPGGCIKYTEANIPKLKPEFNNCVANSSALGSATTADGGGGRAQGQVSGRVIEGWCACNTDYCNKHTMASITATPKPRIITTTEATPEPEAGARSNMFGIVTVILPILHIMFV